MTKLPRDEQPICHLCIRPQEDHTVLFVTEYDADDADEGDADADLGTTPNICDTCVRAAYELLLELWRQSETRAQGHGAPGRRARER